MTLPVTVRPLATDTEYDAFSRLSRQEFSPGAPPEAAGRWRQRVTAAPRFDPSQMRGAFRGGGIGGFERTLADQRHRLSDLIPGNPPMVVSSQQHDPLLAAAPGGDLRGYALLGWRQRERAAEVMADDWEAALALLHAHDA